MTQKVIVNGKTIFLLSDTLKAKCVPEMINIHEDFSEKAIKYEKNHKRIYELKSCSVLGFDGKEELNLLNSENTELRVYLVRNIAEYKQNRQEWVFENVECTKVAI